MHPGRRLEANLASESEAYGYTLSVWGAVALLVGAFGVPGLVGVLAYVGGALAGFATLALVAFGGLASAAAVEGAESPLVVSTIHVAATGGTLVLASGLLELLRSFPPVAVVAAVGFAVTVAYNVLLGLEEYATAAVV